MRGCRTLPILKVARKTADWKGAAAPHAAQPRSLFGQALSGQTDAGQICEEQSSNTLLKGNGIWRADAGRGNRLGATDHCQNPRLTISYAVGRTQGVVTLSPPGVGEVVRALNTSTAYPLWNMRRQVAVAFFDNGVASTLNREDQGPNYAIDITPSKQKRNSDAGVDKLYDADTPGGLAGLNVNHTFETYDNFEAWAQITLDETRDITDHVFYNYQQRIDADNGTGGCYKVELNALAMGSIILPTTPHYPPRPATPTKQ